MVGVRMSVVIIDADPPKKHVQIGRTYEHILVAEKALGRRLPPGAIVHHVDEDPTNNAPTNLVILQSQAEHLALHARLRIQRAGGDPWTEKICSKCQRAKHRHAFNKCRSTSDRLSHRCRECSRAHAKQYPSRWTERRAEQQRVRRAM